MKHKSWSLLPAFLMTALLSTVAAATSAHATLTCTAENDYVASQIKFCSYRISNETGRGRAAAEQAAYTDSIEIQVFRDPANPDDADDTHYIRALFHNANCNSIIQEGYNDTVNRQIVAADGVRAPVCYVGWMNKTEFNTTRSHLDINYNTLANALLSGNGSGAFTIWPSVPALLVTAGPVAVPYVGFRIAKFLGYADRFAARVASWPWYRRILERRAAAAAERAAVERTLPGAAAVEGATAESAAGALAETEVRTAGRVVRTAARRGMQVGTAIIVGYFFYNYLLHPLYESIRTAVNYSWIGDGHQFSEILHAEMRGINGCLMSSNPRGSRAQCNNSMSAVASANDDVADYNSDARTEAVVERTGEAGDAITAAIGADATALDAPAETGTAASASSVRTAEISPPAGSPLISDAMRVSAGMHINRGAWMAFFRRACTNPSDESTCNTAMGYESAGFFRPRTDMPSASSLGSSFHRAP